MADPPLTFEEILELLPHRYPMLLIDRVLEASDDSVVAEKLVSANDPFLRGHFPDRPIMPGVLIIEALAQAAGVGIMIRRRREAMPDRGVALVGVEKARLRLAVRTLRTRGDLFRVAGSASVSGERAAEAEILAGFVDWERGK
jgi:3-hydroxymyristoyl/3-hydroxydecanoyl-(acyl carrier protein) dehydratase